MGDIPAQPAQYADPPEAEHPPTLEQPNPWLIQELLSSGTGLISSYGWFILIVASICYYLWINKLKQRVSSAREDAEYKKNPDLFAARDRAAEDARRRMQEKYDELARIHAEKVKEQEEKKKAERLEYMEAQLRGQGKSSLRKSKVDESSVSEEKTEKKKPSLKSEYNPLMGGASSSGFRAASRNMRGG